MPVEIREIVINAVVNENTTNKDAGMNAEEIEEIIQETIDRVFEMLKKRDEA